MRWKPFLARYVVAVIMDALLAVLEYFVLRLVQGPLQLGAVAVVGSTFTAWVTLHEVSPEERPPLPHFLSLWVVGFVVMWGTYIGLDAWTLKQPNPTRVTVLLPTYTPWPTYTPHPTYTPVPTSTPKPPRVVVVTPTPTATPTLPYGYRKVCAEAPPSPFEEGMEGYICATSRVLLRSRPSGRAPVLGSINVGTRFIVIGGPECGDQRVWWRVRLYYAGGYYGLRGWMPESSPGGDEVYLCPQP